MVQVKFSDIGEGMNEGEILHYFVNEGDEVKVDQPLVELQTDKMVAEIPSPAAGKIKTIHFETGNVITVGTVLIEIDNGQDGSQPQAPKIENHQETEKITIPQQQEFSNRTKRILAAPYTRKIARDLGIDIEQIHGTGPAGRVTDADVYQFTKSDTPPLETEAKVPDHASSLSTDQPAADTIPFSGIRKQIAAKMTHSLTTIPHVTHFEEADLTNVLEFRNELKEDGVNISVAAFFIKAIVITLKEHRIFNARLDEENEVIRLATDYNIGLATNTDSGLMVPVLQQADKKSLQTINKEMKALTKKAQDGKLTPKDMKNGTFTISNVGPLGGVGATPIINHPETGIIAFHKTKKTPVVMENDEIAVRSIMTMSLSFDHRVADGALAISFTNRFTELIEDPKKLLLELV
ncbi:dihydrolipoamide acetyltransferase family protein [Lentibacillus sp. Marseille-P4043]|uniref:dihydrolipoamide acetyltransferase family protein n=1 Tax=Lentibacillus sp. Marseille-P4043 TaxID=2040293 RepID=UPI000D0B25CB|nr:dihydrolipoamide acetyltransferase family protein [Lentibacillus sp. Marseille-P4043]